MNNQLSITVSSKLNYNMQAAIAMRGQTVGQQGYETSQPDEKIDFQLSLSMTSNEPAGFGFDYGNIPPHAEILINSGIGYTAPNWHKITREKWYNAFSNLRRHNREQAEDYERSESPNFYDQR